MLEIRRYKNFDNETVWDLHFRALAPTGMLLRSREYDDDLYDIENHYINNRGEFLIGTLEGKTVCMGALRKKTDSLAEIKRMRVYPEYQRRGYGQIILDRLEESAKQLGYSRICLDTGAKNLAARKFYEKNDYLEVRRGEIVGMAIIFYEKEYWMTRRAGFKPALNFSSFPWLPWVRINSRLLPVRLNSSENHRAPERGRHRSSSSG